VIKKPLVNCIYGCEVGVLGCASPRRVSAQASMISTHIYILIASSWVMVRGLEPLCTLYLLVHQLSL